MCEWGRCERGCCARDVMIVSDTGLIKVCHESYTMRVCDKGVRKVMKVMKAC